MLCTEQQERPSQLQQQCVGCTTRQKEEKVAPAVSLAAGGRPAEEARGFVLEWVGEGATFGGKTWNDRGFQRWRR